MGEQVREPIIIPDDMKEVKDILQKERKENKHFEICQELNDLYIAKNNDYIIAIKGNQRYMFEGVKDVILR